MYAALRTVFHVCICTIPYTHVHMYTHTHSEIPQELVHAAKGGEVDVNIEDMRNEPYTNRAPKLVAFSGEGRKLGRLAVVE